MIRWDAQESMWVCKNFDRCGGAGYGYDIFDDSTFKEERER